MCGMWFFPAFSATRPPLRSGAPSPALTRAAQRNLLRVRVALVLLELCGVLVLSEGVGVHTHTASLFALVGLHGVLMAAAAWRLRGARRPLPEEIALELVTDAGLLGALIYFTGGYANPFISLLLVPLLLAATVLSRRATWMLAAWTVVLYSLLAFFYQPLALPVSTANAVDLHLAGMWLNFIFTALFVTLALVRLAAALRERETHLAAARERALRDEQLFLLGMQAASAAHDLATPLATLKLGLDQLQQDFAGDDELTPPLTRMAHQAERMQTTLARLAVAAGAARAQSGTATVPDCRDWLQETFAHWQLMRPRVQAELVMNEVEARPADAARVARWHDVAPRLVSVLTTLLNNAADVSPASVRLQADCEADAWVFRVLDRGPGFANAEPPEGREGDLLESPQDKTGGWGVGLLLAAAALERLGGALTMAVRAGGGRVASVRVPVRPPAAAPVKGH